MGAGPGLLLFIGIFFVVSLILPGLAVAQVSNETGTAILNVTPPATTIPPSPPATGSPLTNTSLPEETPPATTRGEATNVSLSPPPVLILETPEIDNLTVTLYGTAAPGSVNVTIEGIRWDWGNNEAPEYHAFPFSNVYSGPGEFTITITALQSDGQNVTRTTNVSLEEPLTTAPTVPATTVPPQQNSSIPVSPGGPGIPGGAPFLTLLEPVIDGYNVTLNGNLNPGSPMTTISSVLVDWDDGNTTNSTDLPVTHRYAGPGIFTISITGNQSDGQSTTKRITLDLKPGIAPGSTPPGPPPGDNNLPLFLIILGTAIAVTVIGGIAQRINQRRREKTAQVDIPKAVSMQEEIYYQARERGDMATAAASAHITAQMLRSLTDDDPKKRKIYLQMADAWDKNAREAGKGREYAPGRAAPSLDRQPSREILERICSGTDVSPDVLDSVLRVAREIAIEGREGQAVGTSFVVGDTEKVLSQSKQFVLNPFHGHLEEERQITNEGLRGNIKEFAQLDGAFLISGNGVVEAAGRYITVDMSRVSIPGGLGSRHSSIAGITLVTRSIGIVVSQSGGTISVFKDGTIVLTLNS